MNKLVMSHFILFFILSLTLPGSASSEELSYAMAQCHLSVYKLPRLDKTYNENGLKFQKVLYNGNEVLLMKPRWTGLNVHVTPFIKVFTYRYSNANSLYFDVTVESYCNQIPKDHLLRLFKKQRISYVPAARTGCYMLDMTNAAKEFAQYRYGIMCLSNKNLMFAHLTPSEGEKNSITVTPATVTPTPDEKKKISEDLNRLTEFYMNQVDNYVAEKFTIDLTDISAKKSTKKREKKLS